MRKFVSGPLPLFKTSFIGGLTALASVLALTVASQVGGLILWFLFPLAFYCASKLKKTRLFTGLCVLGGGYCLIVFAVVPPVAGLFGRVPLPCRATEETPLGPRNFAYCLLMRNYVRPQLREAMTDISIRVNKKFPNTITVYLDGNLSFIDGFPLLPHLSHSDGKKLDIAFCYHDKENANIFLNSPSPIGYWVYEQPKPDEYQPCKGKKSLLRWDFDILQFLHNDIVLDKARTNYLIKQFISDKRIAKILLEPYLKRRLGLRSRKIRFQGCNAARHDDHMHIQVY